MRDRSFDITPAAAVIICLLWYLDDSGLIAALLPAVAVHELGHAAAVWLTNGRVTVFRITALGAEMRCTPPTGGGHSALRSLAGPIAGAVYAYAASVAGRLIGSDFLLCSAGISLVLSLFNLLPHPSLDGGRVLLALLDNGEETVSLLGFLSSAALMAAGVTPALNGRGYALIAAALALLALSIFEKRQCADTGQKRKP